MKTQPPSRKFILTSLIAATAGLALAAPGSAQTVTNPVSAFFHTTDGQFTNGVGVGEWSDVLPSAFISSPGGSAIPTTISDPLANSLLFAGLGRVSAASDFSLHLLYDFLPRTTSPLPGETFASVTFPVHLPQGLPGGGEERNISVLFSSRNLADGEVAGGVGSFFDIFVDLDLDGSGDIPALALGITGAADFGPSPLSTVPHLLVELDVPLRIPAGFANPSGPLPGNGINPATGLYDPDPAFWGAAGAGDGTLPGAAGDAPPPFSLQSASTGIFTIDPNGGTLVVPVPEPSSALLLLAALGLFGARRRKA